MDIPRVIITGPPFLRRLAHGTGVDDAAVWVIGLIAAGLFFYFFMRDQGEGETDPPESGTAGDDKEMQD